MDPNNRITKDTSARKNTSQPGMHSAMEMAAVKGAHKAYLDIMIQGYEEKIQTIEGYHEAQLNELKAVVEQERAVFLEDQKAKYEEQLTELEAKAARDQAAIDREREAEHQAQVAQLKAEFEQERTALMAKQQEVITKAVQARQELAEADPSILQAQIDKLRQERHELAAQQAGQIQAIRDKGNGIISEKKREIKDLQQKVEDLKAYGKRSRESLRDQLEAWVEINFGSPGSQTRTFAYRTSTSWTLVASDLSKAIGKPVSRLRFNHGVIAFQDCGEKTLKEVRTGLAQF